MGKKAFNLVGRFEYRVFIFISNNGTLCTEVKILLGTVVYKIQRTYMRRFLNVEFGFKRPPWEVMIK